MPSSFDVRAAYLEGAHRAQDLIQREDVRARWAEPSALSQMTIGELIGHLGRAILQVVTCLDAQLPQRQTSVNAERYEASLSGTADLGSDLNVGVRERAAETAADGPEHLIEAVQTALARLRTPLASLANPTMAIPIHPGEVMAFDEYLRTRCVELAVHLDDLALSLGIEPSIPARTLAVAVEVLVGAARLRSGDAAVLHALARRERDSIDALRIF